MINKKVSKFFTILIFTAIVILIFNDNLNYSGFRSFLRIPKNPFIRIMDFITEMTGRDMSEDMLTLYLSECKLENRSLKYLKDENKVLRDMLQFKTFIQYFLVPAEVIGGNPGDESEIIVNKGSKDNIQTGMCALFLNGIIGKVIECSDNSSIVETHSNVNFKIGVCDKDRKYFMIAYFHSKGVLKVENIQYNVVLKENDSLFTSGFGNIYPPNILMGTIKQIIKNSDGEYFYLILPAEKISSLKFVYLTQKVDVSIPSIFSENKSELIGSIGWYKMYGTVK